jgi:hypothetical protein
MTTRTACFDSGGGARRRRSVRQVWQGRRLDGSARSVAVDLLGLQPTLLDFSASPTVAIWWALIICVTALGIVLEGFGASRR